MINFLKKLKMLASKSRNLARIHYDFDGSPISTYSISRNLAAMRAILYGGINGNSVVAAIKKNIADIATNRKDISTNRTNISTNRTNIATNKDNIAINAAAIEVNAKGIAENATNIATNSNDIAINTYEIKDINTTISTMKDMIRANAYPDMTDLDPALTYTLQIHDGVIEWVEV